MRDGGEGGGLDLGNGPEVLGVVLFEGIRFVGCSPVVVRGKVGYYYRLIGGIGLFGNRVLFYYWVCPVMVQEGNRGSPGYVPFEGVILLWVGL